MCDIVVLETGMGGDQDATNVVTTTILEVITAISLDHLGVLGNNLKEIAACKAGIIKEGDNRSHSAAKARRDGGSASDGM